MEYTCVTPNVKSMMVELKLKDTEADWFIMTILDKFSIVYGKNKKRTIS